MGLAELVCSGAIRGGTSKGPFNEFEEIIPDEKCFKLSTPLREGRGCQFFVDLGSDIECNDLFVCCRGGLGIEIEGCVLFGHGDGLDR